MMDIDEMTYYLDLLACGKENANRHKLNLIKYALRELQSCREENERLREMPARVVAMRKKRGWSLHWTNRGAYLHLEASELIEAIRGKHGEPEDEAGDVLLVLMSITEYAGIPFSKVIQNAANKLAYLEDAPPYPGREIRLKPQRVKVEGWASPELIEMARHIVASDNQPIRYSDKMVELAQALLDCVKEEGDG